MNELKTIRKTLNNTTTEFKFDEVGAKFLIKNFSENDCYVSFDQTTIDTNSVKISAGKAFLLMTDEYKPEGARSVYVLGTGEIEVRMVLKYWRSGGKNTVFSGSQYFMNVNKSEGGGSAVVANPVLQGGEDALTGLEVDGSKYRIDNTTYQTFPSGWTTTGTIAQFCAAVNADSAAVEGMAYLGELRCSDLPTGLGNVEAVVEVVDGTGTSGKTIHITITSGNVSPYRWEYTYWNDGTNVSGWKTWLSTEGGTVTGNIEVSVDNFYISRISGGNDNGKIVGKSGNTVILGSDSVSSNNVMLVKGTNGKAYTALQQSPNTTFKYEILDADNTQANPTLAGTEESLTGLKINGTSYKVDSGYTIHTYTPNKTYTSADADYEQLRDDLTNNRMIKIGNYVYIPIYSTSSTMLYSALQVDNQYYIGAFGYTITISSNNVVISAQAFLNVPRVEANPTLAGTESNLTGIEVGSTKYKLGYLPLSGGTLTGHLNLGATNVAIQDYQGNYLLRGTSNSTNLGNTSKGIELITSSNDDIKHLKGGGTPINVLDEDNTSANPTLLGTETALTSLKLNGTNYAIAGGTQVTFVDWS